MMDKRKVAFFIDDDPDFLEVIQEVVQHPRFDIHTYATDNGYKAIDEAIKQKPDVLFIDFNLPRANGGQILPVIKSVEALNQVPVYFVTGLVVDEVKTLLRDLEYDGILQKGDTLSQEIIQILDALAPAEVD